MTARCVTGCWGPSSPGCSGRLVRWVARNYAFAPPSIVRLAPVATVYRQPPLKGEQPTVDLVVGYHRANASPILKMFLSRIDDFERAGGAQARQTTIKRAPGRGRSRPPALYSPPGELTTRRSRRRCRRLARRSRAGDVPSAEGRRRGGCHGPSPVRVAPLRAVLGQRSALPIDIGAERGTSRRQARRR